MPHPDVSVLGQILAAQNVLFVLPSTQTIAEFYASALASLPGVRWSRVCLGEASAQVGPLAADVCAGCPGKVGRASTARCQLASAAQTCVVAAETIDKCYGFFIVGIDQLELVEPYRVFIGNLAGFVALHLENREKHDWQDERRRLAEDRLRKLSRAVEQSPVSIVITDTSGKIEYVNPKFTEVTGYTLSEVQGQNPRLLKSGHTSGEAYAKLWRTISSGKEWRGEFQNRRRNGELFWESASISPIFDDATRTITHFVAVKTDITERRRLEAELRQAQKLEALGQLAGGVAHDFNNILALMVMGINALREQPGLSPEACDGLDDLQCEAERATGLIRQLLLFGRRQTPDLKPLDLNLLIANLTKMLRRLIGEGIDLVIQPDDTDLWVKADASMAEQILLNLCVNARDAMPRGGVLTITTDRMVKDAEQALPHGMGAGVFACLSVKDTGCGMDSATLQRIFEPFFTTKGVGKGTGLGLATVYGIVKQHQGWIEVESTPGQGSTFHVLLPALAKGDAKPGTRAAPS